MRNLFVTIIAISFLACTRTPSYRINVQLTGAEGMAYLSQRINGEWLKKDSAQLENGVCKFEGAVKYPEVYFLSVSEEKDKLPFFIENAVIRLSGEAGSLPKTKITGSAVNNEFQTLQLQLDQLDNKAMEFYKESKENEKEGFKMKADSLMTLTDNLSIQIDDLQKEYIKAHPASWISPYLLSRVFYDMEADVLNDFLKGLDVKLDSVSLVVSLKKRVDKLEMVAIGKIAPDFTMNDILGNPVKLSNIYSKNSYTLVDFWASWCGPCRRENPNVVSVFNSFRNKGFGVLGISLDTDNGKWLKAIDSDKLTWTHLSDLKGWKNEVALLYSVNSIPANILIDNTGKIVGRNLREEKLREAIEGLLN
jgi:peroxiredoxin